MTTEPGTDPAISPATGLLAIAPPGCGKTELLARRAAHLLPSLKPHQKILALTFSNRAKHNLAERLQQVLGPQRFRRYVKVTNFHGHAADIISAHGRTIGLDPSALMPTRSTLTQAIAQYTRGLSVPDKIELRSEVEAALAAAKQDALDDQAVLAALVRSGNQVAQQIEADRQARGILHYHDLLRNAQRILQNAKVANLYQQHYAAVLVDEFQDLSPQQLDIALASCTTNRTFVGDPLQGIYSWAGARPAQVEKDLRDLLGEPHHLEVSYRSSPAVLGVVNSVADLLGGLPLRAADPSAWPGAGAAAALVFESGVKEAEWMADTAARILAANPKATIGVISRAGWRRAVVDAAINAAQLPKQQWDLPIDDSDVVVRLLETVQRLPRQADMTDVRASVLNDVDPTDVEARDQMTQALELFEELVKETGTPRAALARLRAADPTRAIEPGIHLLNAHTGKGQQFDWVFIPGVEDFHIPGPRAETAEQVAEELRVLLVMLSRARHGIVVSRALTLLSRAGNPYSTQASRWWDAATAACYMDSTEVADHIARLSPAGRETVSDDHPTQQDP